MTGNFLDNILDNIFFEYSLDNTTQSSDVSIPFKVSSIPVQISGDYMFSNNYGLIGYEFDSDFLINSIRFIKKEEENNIKNTDAIVISNGVSIGTVGNLQNKTDTNRIIFSTDFGNFFYSQGKNNNFNEKTKENNYFSYTVERPFIYYLGNKLFLYFNARLLLSSDNSNSFTLINNLCKVTENSKGLGYAGITYSKYFNTKKSYDVDSKLDLTVLGDLQFGENKFINGKYTYTIPTLKDSSASSKDITSFSTVVGKARRSQLLDKTYYKNIDNWKLGWQ